MNTLINSCKHHCLQIFSSLQINIFIKKHVESFRREWFSVLPFMNGDLKLS